MQDTKYQSNPKTIPISNPFQPATPPMSGGPIHAARGQRSDCGSPVRYLEAAARPPIGSSAGGLGIVADDAMARVYAALVLLFAGWFHWY